MKSKSQSKSAQTAKDLFWDRCIKAARSKGIKESVVKWYVVRVEQYLKAHSKKRLVSHTAEDVEPYFTTIGRQRILKHWQFYQMVDALRILFETIVKSEWASGFAWDYWLASAKELEREHPTVAREYNRLEPSITVSDSRSSESDRKNDNEQVLLRIVREIRRRHYSIRTERAYVDWIARFISYHRNQRLDELDGPQIVSFLEYPALERKVSASTQNQALNAIAFLYNQILKKPMEDPGEFSRAKRPRKLPVVLSRREMKRFF